MGLLNAKCILLVVLFVVAIWSFPIGLLVDAAIITLWMFIRKKSKKTPQQGTGGDPGLSDAIKALTLIVAGDKLGALATRKDAAMESKATTTSPAAPAIKPASEYSTAFRKRLAD
jgi:hypothetical protein